jgi:hypothetical protein
MKQLETLHQTDEPQGKPMCPSFRCAEGALLLGIVKPDGLVAFANSPLVVTKDFVDIAQAGSRVPEKRFRFAGPCQSCKCSNWNKGDCEIVELAVAWPGERSERDLPDCSIRPDCKWYLQRGDEACRVCPEITTQDPCQL